LTAVALPGRDSVACALPKLGFAGEKDVEKCEMRFQIGKVRQVQRSENTKNSLQITPPSTKEMAEIHNIFINFEKSKDSVQVDQTKLLKYLIMHQQERNVNGMIFGGYLMREAYELGWLTAFMHCETYAEVFHIADFQFLKTIEIGGCMKFEAKIGYTLDNLIHVNIACFQILKNKKVVQTNDMNVTFSVGKDCVVKPIVPVTYEEAMTYIDSKRRISELLQ